MKNSLGIGTLTWGLSERVSDRYGSIYLIADGKNSHSKGSTRSLVNQEVSNGLVGRRGELVAVVKKSRQSTHIGDIFHGLSPSTPEIGEIIILGRGMFFTEPAPDGGIQVGLSPHPDDEARPNGWWLDAPQLYRAHEQTVQLFFEET